VDICKIGSEEEIRIQFKANLKISTNTICHTNNKKGYLQRVLVISELRTCDLKFLFYK